MEKGSGEDHAGEAALKRIAIPDGDLTKSSMFRIEELEKEKMLVSSSCKTMESETWEKKLTRSEKSTEAALEAKQMDFVKEKLQMVGCMSDFEMQLKKNTVEEQWELQQEQQHEATWVVENRVSSLRLSEKRQIPAAILEDEFSNTGR
ncbi:unnamed protein product [Sphagnum jensenii]|uniref:Uncharacterized protein n=1 Tax=Sphagnum jensenii TaxID=128206 RepID=A0ABP0WPE8_9BRYO